MGLLKRYFGSVLDGSAYDVGFKANRVAGKFLKAAAITGVIGAGTARHFIHDKVLEDRDLVQNDRIGTSDPASIAYGSVYYAVKNFYDPAAALYNAVVSNEPTVEP